VDLVASAQAAERACVSKQPVKAKLLDALLSDVLLPPLPANVPEAVVGPSLVDHNMAVRQLLTGATCIEASNVARYFEENYIGNDRDFSAWQDDLKCLVPPHEKFFVEWERPNIPGAKRMGVLFVACAPHEVERIACTIFAREGIGSTLKKIALYRENVRCKWIYLTADFLEFLPEEGYVSRLRGPFHVGVTAVAEDGSVLGTWFQISSGIEREDSIRVLAASLVGWTALAMLNCQNIVTDAHQIPEPFQKSRKKSGKRPLVSFHTIRVDLDKTPRQVAADTLPGDGSTPRRHKKRGHMKDYRGGKGLFGRYKGVWYWGPTLAGSAEEGVVVSDYEVNP
jgi:hypothetical protein